MTLGDGEQGLQSVHNILFLFFLPSHTISLLCPSLTRHFTNFSCVGLPMGWSSSQTALVWVFTWAAALRNRLLQCVLPSRKPALTWAPLWPQFLPGTCSSMDSPWTTASFRSHPPASVWHPPWPAGGWNVSWWFSSWSERESLLQHLQHLLLVLIHYGVISVLTHSCCGAVFTFS